MPLFHPQTNTISSGNWLDVLPVHIRSDLEKHFSFQQFNRGDMVYEQGSEADKLFHIVDGEVRISNYFEDGREHVHIIFQQGESFGDIGLLDNETRGTAAVANMNTQLGVLSKKDFFSLRQRYREIDATLLLLYCHRLRNLLAWSEQANCLELPQRIAKRLQVLSEFHGKPCANQGRGIEIKVTQENLAKMLGAARQSVGKALKEMEARGGLKIQYGKITVYNTQQLHG